MSQRSRLEHQLLELELDNRELHYNLVHAREEGRSHESVSRQLRDQLERLESRLSGEVEGRQVAELRVRELEVKLHTVQASHNQLQDEQEQLKGRLQAETEKRSLQEGLYQEQVSTSILIVSTRREGLHTLPSVPVKSSMLAV